MEHQQTEQHQYRRGLQGVLGAMFMWGLLPIYWKSLVPIDSFVIMAYRMILACGAAILMARLQYPFREIFAPLKDRKKALRFLLIGFLITVNWSVFIYTVNSGRILQASLGYFIEPVVICLLGVIIYREKWTPYNIAAVGLAGVGILVMLIHTKEIPGLALVLALTFAVYGAFKKGLTEPPLVSLTCETLLMVPLALVFILVAESTGHGAFQTAAPYQLGLLLLSGVLTAVPLGLFAFSAQRVSMFVLGLAEYVSPTLNLLVGVFLYHEPLDMVQLLAFGIIWVGLAVFSLGEFRQNR